VIEDLGRDPEGDKRLACVPSNMELSHNFVRLECIVRAHHRDGATFTIRAAKRPALVSWAPV